MVLTSAGVVAAAVTVAVYAIVRGASPAGLPAGRCDVTSTVSASADPAERPIAIARDATAAWVLMAAPKANATDGAVRVRLARVPDEGTTSIAHTAEAPSLDAVSGFAITSTGVTFAISRRDSVTEYTVSPSGAVSEKPFPRGEIPAERRARIAALALAGSRDGVSALARYGAPFAAVRVNDRDVRESDAYTPRRNDSFRAPDLAIARDAVLLAQEHVAGSFSGAASRASIELVALDPSPAHPDVRSTVTLNREGTTGAHPRVALLDPERSGAGVVSVWRDEHGLAAARALPGADLTWRAHEFMRVLDAQSPEEAVTGDHDVASTGVACASVAAWRSGDDLAMRAFDLARGLSGDVVRVALPLGDTAAGAAARVRVERSGARVFAVSDGAAGPKLFELTVTDACGLTARPLALPASASSPGVRVAGFAASASVAVLGLTRALADAAETPMTFVSVAATPSQAPRLAPTAVTLRQAVTELTLLAGDVPVAVGRARGSVMLQRIDGAADEDGPGEDLLLRGMRGEELATDASATLHRVWVADVSGDEETAFGPPRSVVLHSAIDGLEDGPRTEVRTATVPYADFAGVTLAALSDAGDAAWGATLSGSAGGDCVAGAWATLRTADDRPIAPRTPSRESPWPWMVPLVPQAERSCADRVLSAHWRGSRLAAAVAGERVGARLVTGDVRDGELRSRALDERAESHVRLPAIAPSGRGLIALWLDGSQRSPSLRYRMFSTDGVPRTEVVTLGELTEAPTDERPGEAIPFAALGDRLVAALRTVHGPRVARLSCGAVP